MKMHYLINDRNFRNVGLIFLLIYLLYLTKDYGISYDEFWYRDIGFAVLNFLGENLFPEKLLEIKKSRNLNYLPLQGVLDVAPIGFKIQHTIYSTIEYLFFSESEKKDVFIMRHYLNFLMSSFMFIIFYKILRLRFNKILSSVGLIMLILSPKIFSDYYYSPNDIWAFFSSTLITYCSLYFFKKKKYKYFYFLGFLFALGINTRLIFIYLYAIFLFLLILKNQATLNKIFYKNVILQFLIFIFFLYLITPQLWIDFFGIIDTLMQQLKHGGKTGDAILYFMGDLQRSSELPIYYTFIWILISTPSLYLIAFFVGIFVCLFNFKDSFLNYKSDDLIFIFLYFLIPVLAILIIKPSLYNGWRHFYFLNLSIIYFSVIGLEFFFKLLNSKKLNYLFSFLIFFYFINISIWMIVNHPYQHVYFNNFAKKYNNKFELDYWGLSNSEALNYIINNSQQTNKIIKIKALGRSRIIYAYKALDSNSQKKIEILSRDGLLNADYYITNFHDGKNKKHYSSSGFEILKEIKVDNFPINIIMKYNN